MPEWIRDELGWFAQLLERYGIWFIGASVALVVVGLFLMRLFVIRIPHDYFISNRRRFTKPDGRHPVFHIALIVMKNFVGIVLILAGVILSLPGVPGPGILTLLIGLSLTDIPGKRTLELKIIRNRVLLNTINKIRTRANKLPLDVREQEPSALAKP
jgi:hypothetical protein